MRMEAELPPVPRIEAALDELALPWAVASNSSTDGVRRSLVRTRLLHRFGYAARTDPDRLAAEGAEPFESMDELPALLTAG